MSLLLLFADSGGGGASAKTPGVFRSRVLGSFIIQPMFAGPVLSVLIWFLL